MQKLLFLSTCLLFAAGISYAGGTWVDTSFVSTSLGFSNQVRIYLPESYDPEGTINYPTIYWLHAWNIFGDPGHTANSANTKLALDSLIASGQIQPVIVVKPNGTCPPYNGSCWVNSELYGEYEDYVVYDLVDFMESNFCVLSDPEFRCIAGHSMGGTGSMDLALRHPDRYLAVASHSGLQDLQTGLAQAIPVVIGECPEPAPPYTYNWDNGMYTNLLFLMAGAYSPNLTTSDSINFLLDENGAIIDSVYALWEMHNPAHMIKLSPQPDIELFFDCGQEDSFEGCYEANCGYADTLTALGEEFIFQDLPGVSHLMNLDRFIQEFLFLGYCMTGLEEGSVQPDKANLLPPFPNPFTSSTTISFVLPEPTRIRLDVFDITGRLVTTLVDDVLINGEHSIVLNATDLTSGMYFYKLEAGNNYLTGRCIKL